MPCGCAESYGWRLVCGESANFKFLIPLAIVHPDNLSGCVGLNNNVVTNAKLYWDGFDELMDVWWLFGL